MAVIQYLFYIQVLPSVTLLKRLLLELLPIFHLPSCILIVYLFMFTCIYQVQWCFQFFIFFPFASLRSCDCLGMLLTECNKLGLLSDSNTVNLTSKRYGFLCYQKTCDYGYFRTKITYTSFLKILIILMRNENGILSTIFMSFPPTPPSYPHPLPLPFYPSPPANLIQDRGQGVRPQAKDRRKC